MASLVRRDGQLVELAAGARIDGHDRVRLTCASTPMRINVAPSSRSPWITGGQLNVEITQVRLPRTLPHMPIMYYGE